MKLKRLPPFWSAIFMLLIACGERDKAPEHFYVLCDGRDGAGWLLVDTAYDENGYLIGCTYQSPNRKQAYTVTCTSEGCD